MKPSKREVGQRHQIFILLIFLPYVLIILSCLQFNFVIYFHSFLKFILYPTLCCPFFVGFLFAIKNRFQPAAQPAFAINNTASITLSYKSPMTNTFIGFIGMLKPRTAMSGSFNFSFEHVVFSYVSSAPFNNFRNSNALSAKIVL